MLRTSVYYFVLAAFLPSLGTAQEFGQVAVGSSSPGQTITVPLTTNFSAPSATLAYGLDFQLGAINCGHIGLAASCTASIIFSPKYAGVRQDALIIKDESGKLLVAQSLRGEGLAPQAGIVPGLITTVAGNGAIGYAGDGGLATHASLSTPIGVAIDAADNIYIADWNNHVVRKVTKTTGVITTIAGDGSLGYTGDGGPATQASLSNPYSIAIDPAGDIYICDQGNHAIRRVDGFSGIITTVAGGTKGYTGDGGPATKAALNFPSGIAVDASGNLYISDTDNDAIRIVAASTGLIRTISGNGTGGYSGDGGPAAAAKLYEPLQIVLDAMGNLFIADSRNNVVRRIDSKTGVITTVAGDGAGLGPNRGDGGPATQAGLSHPEGIAVDPAGNLYIAVYLEIRKVDAATGVITTIAGDSNLGVIDGSGDGGPATLAGLGTVGSIALDSAGNLLIPDGSASVRMVYAQQGALAFSATSTESSSVFPVSISNIGTLPLTFGAFTFDLNSSFAESTEGGCSTSTPLITGDVCTIPIAFQPSGQNTFRSTLTVTDNALNQPNSTQTITLSGSAQLITASPASLVFSNPNTYYSSAAQTITVTNGGTAPAVLAINLAGPNASEFSETDTCSGSIAAKGSCTIAIVFTRLGAGNRSATVNIAPKGSTITTSVVVSGVPSASGCPGVSLAANPNPIYSASGFGTTTITANAGCAYQVRVGSPTGPLFMQTGFLGAGPNSGGMLTGATGNWVTDGMTFYMQQYGDTTPQGTLAVVTAAVIPASCAVSSLTASPNPIPTASLWGATTLTVNASSSCIYQIRVGGPDGPLLATLAGQSSATTGNWVTDGMYFYVQEVNNTTPAGTLAKLAVGVFAPSVSMDFGSAELNTSSPVTKSLSFSLGAVSSAIFRNSGQDFAVGAASCTSSNGSFSCTVPVSFAPKLPGARSGAVLAVDSGGTVLQTIIVHGIGLGPEAVTFPGTLSVIAPNGTKTYSGGGSGVEIHPNQVAIDTAGNVLVADATNSVIWRIDAQSGAITRIAGTVGNSGYAGDGGAATKAELGMPQGVAVDAAGNIFVADTQNYRIRRIDAQTGTITTYAGAGTQDTSGDGGLAINSGFNLPISLGFDPQGNLYVADQDSLLLASTTSVRKIGLSSGVITTVFEGQGAGTNFAFDSVGNLYVCIAGGIQVLNASTGAITSVPTGSLTITAVAVDAAGDIYAAAPNGNIGILNPSTGQFVAIALPLPVIPAILGIPGLNLGVPPITENSLALDQAGSLYFSDSLNEVSKLAFSGTSFAFPLTGIGQTNIGAAGMLANIGNRPLSLSGVNVSAPFTQPATSSGDCATAGQLAGGSICDVSVAFTPPTQAGFTGSATLIDSSLGSSSQQQIALVGTGSQLVATPLSLTFTNPNLYVPSPAQAVTVTNYGSTATAVSIKFEPTGIFSFANSAEFAETDNCGGMLAGGGSCQVFVTYTPNLSFTFILGSVTIPGSINVPGLLSISAPGSSIPNLISLSGSSTSPSCGAVSLTASPATIFSDTGFGMETLTATAGCAFQVRVGSPSGPIFFATANGPGGATESATTGEWVTDGMRFYLQKFGDTTPQGSLAVWEAGVVPANCKVAGFQAAATFGNDAIYGVATLSVDANASCIYQIRVNAPNGPLFAILTGQQSATTGVWVLPGMNFYLQELGNTTPSGTLASASAGGSQICSTASVGATGCVSANAVQSEMATPTRESAQP